MRLLAPDKSPGISQYYNYSMLAHAAFKGWSARTLRTKIADPRSPTSSARI